MGSYGNIGQPVYAPPVAVKKKSSLNKLLLLLVIVLVLSIILLLMNPALVQRINTGIKGATYQSDFVNLIAQQSPQVVQVVDPIKVQQDNPESGLFYQTSQKDDVVLIYEDLAIAVLYRPSTKQIINVTLIQATN
jgi:predicted PurR-regulated permease PerM